MVEKAAALLCEKTLLFLKSKQHVVIALPGGRSVAGIYENLRDCPLPWGRVHIFLLDERLVPADHPESNYRLVQQHLGSGVISPLIYPLHLDVDNPAQSVKDYNSQLERYGSRFDIVLASSGEDGHIASLFPNHHSMEEKTGGFFLFHDSPKPPLSRMTASQTLIRQSDTGIVLFFGDAKRRALNSFLKSQQPINECPARIFTLLPHHYVLTDLEVNSP